MLNSFFGDSKILVSGNYTQRNPEIKQAFVLNSYGEFDSSLDYYTERDGLPNFLVMSTLRGQGWIQYGQAEADLRPGTIVIINCENYQYYRTKSNEGWHFRWIHFASDFAGTLVDMINQSGIAVLNFDPHHFSHIYQSMIDHTHYASLYSETQISLLLHRLLTDILARKTADALEKISSKKAELDQLLIYIKNNYNHELTLDELADHSRISKFYLIRLFREMTGTSPYRYIVMTRVDEAKKMLQSTARRVEEIAELTGFCDSKNFISTFKRMTGLTPLQFRKTSVI
jgi:AraC-like DNA-binding protein